MKSTHLKASGFTAFSSRERGFTLIELLVVIAIISILAAISVTVFSGAQGSARDGKRRSEVTSIAKSIEAAKDYATGIYRYDLTVAGNDFPKGVPEDPSTARKYCISMSTSTAPTADATTWGDSDDCPTVPAAALPDTTAYMTLSTAYTAVAGAPDFSDGTVKSFNICTKLERSSTRYCVSSLTK